MSIENRVSFSSHNIIESDVCHTCYLPDGGRITVLDRMTGFGWRDIETGYLSPCGRWFLASGHYDIRRDLHKMQTHDEMAQWVIDRANTCTGDNLRTNYSRVMPECFA